jgi:hypothetical protein
MNTHIPKGAQLCLGGLPTPERFSHNVRLSRFDLNTAHQSLAFFNEHFLIRCVNFIHECASISTITANNIFSTSLSSTIGSESLSIPESRVSIFVKTTNAFSFSSSSLFSSRHPHLRGKLRQFLVKRN